jgi:hypothetical protein
MNMDIKTATIVEVPVNTDEHWNWCCDNAKK